MSAVKPLTVLVVDDVKPILNELTNLLEESGILTLQAGDGLEALKLFTTDAPDAVLMDGMLPKMSGFNACQQIKAMPGGEKTPVIMVTGVYKKHKYRSDALAIYQADDYLHKPFQKQLILATLQKHISRYQSLDNMIYEERLAAGMEAIEEKRKQAAAAPPPPPPPEEEKPAPPEVDEDGKLPAWDLSKEKKKGAEPPKAESPEKGDVHELDADDESMTPPAMPTDLPDPVDESEDERVAPPTVDRAHSVDFIPGKQAKEAALEEDEDDIPEVPLPDPEEEIEQEEKVKARKKKRGTRDVYVDHLLAPFRRGKARRKSLPKGHQTVVSAAAQEPTQGMKGVRAKTAKLLREFMSTVEVSPIFTSKNLFDFALNRDLARYNRFGEYFALVSLPLRHIAVMEPVEGVTAAEALLEALEARLRDCDVMTLEVGGPTIHVLLAYATEDGAKAYLQQVTEMVHPGFLDALRFRYATCPEDGATITDLFGALANHEMNYSQVIEWAAQRTEDDPEPQKVAVAHAIADIQDGLEHAPPMPIGLRNADPQPQPQPANASALPEGEGTEVDLADNEYEVDLDDDSTADSKSRSKSAKMAKNAAKKDSKDKEAASEKASYKEEGQEELEDAKTSDKKEDTGKKDTLEVALPGEATVEISESGEQKDDLTKKGDEDGEGAAKAADEASAKDTSSPDEHKTGSAEKDADTEPNKAGAASAEDEKKTSKTRGRKKKRKKSSRKKAKAK